MAGVNKVILLGNCGKDPEIRYLPSGKAVANFSIATSEKYKDKSGNTVENTEWHNCEAWEKTAEIVEKFLKKGNKVYVEGKIKTDSWEDNGVKKYAVKIRVESLQLLESHNNNTPSNRQDPDLVQDNSTDIPF